MFCFFRLLSEPCAQDNGLPLWRPPKEAAPDAVLDANAIHDAAADEERNRLLYVAMTRAETWLIVAGAQPGNMPELNWSYGYFVAIGVMVIIALGMVIFFKRKKWL